MLFSADSDVTGELRVDQTSIEEGESVTLIWTASGAVSASIDNGIGSVNPAGGSTSVTPSTSTEYTLTLVGVRGTIVRTAPVSVTVAGAVASFRVVNWGAATSKGFIRVGLPFKAGDVPTGSSLHLKRAGNDIDAQFDRRKYDPITGDLTLCSCCLRDDDFTAGEERTYDIIVVPSSSFDNTGTKSLSDVTATEDLKMAYTEVKSLTDGSAYGSGSYELALNTLALGLSSRIEQTESGAVCDTFKVWGMAQDSGGTLDAHLKGWAIVSIWKNADDSINDIEYCFVSRLDWYNAENLTGLNVSNKTGLRYKASLYNGATLIQSYVSTDFVSLKYQTSDLGYVEHPYKTWWVSVYNQDDDNCGRPFWKNQMPTLLYKPDRAYWVSTEYIPPLDLTLSPNAHTASMPGITGRAAFGTYNPCSPQDHRASINGTGNYQGRGLLTNMDCLCFLRQGARDLRDTRLNGLVACHLPFHVRSNFLGTKPGKSADISDSLCSLRFRQLNDGSDNFTSVGMPARAHAYTKGVSGAILVADGITKTYVNPTGGTGSWGAVGNDNSHIYSPGYFAYLMEPSDYLLEATLDMAQKATQDGYGNTVDKCPGYTWFQKRSVAAYTSLNIPPTTGASAVVYSGVCVNGNANYRAVAWGLLLILRALQIVPDDNLHSGYIRLYAAQQSLFLKNNLQYIPQKLKDAAAYGYLVSSDWVDTTFFGGIIAQAACAWVLSTRDANMLAFIDQMMKNIVVYCFGQSQNYRSDDYRRQLLVQGRSEWDTATNDIPAIADIKNMTDGTIDLATGVITANNPNFFLRPDNGDIANVHDYTDNPATIPVPSGFSLGTTYYVVQADTSTRKFKLSETEDGSPIVPGGSGNQSIGFSGIWACYDQPVMTATLHLPVSSDTNAMMAYAAVAMLRRTDSSYVTQSLYATASTFVSPQDRSNWVTWWLVAA